MIRLQSQYVAEMPLLLHCNALRKERHRIPRGAKPSKSNVRSVFWKWVRHIVTFGLLVLALITMLEPTADSTMPRSSVPYVVAVVVLALITMMEPTAGALVKLEVDPPVVNSGLTKSMTLRCWIERGVLPITSPDVIGRRVAAASQSSVTYDVDMSHVMSIIVTRLNTDTGVNQTVATVSSYDSVAAKEDVDILQVEGETELPSSSLKMGYLQLTWDHPVQQHTGVYSCEVFGLNSVLHSEYSSLSVQVGHREPTTGDVATFVAGLDRYVNSLETKVESMEKEMAILQSEAENKTRECQGQIDALTNTTQTLMDMMGKGFGAKLQTGYIQCSGSSQTILQQFDLPFQNNPKIMLALSNVTSHSNSYPLETSIQSSSNAEFTLVCSRSNYQFAVAWLAYEE